MKLPRVVLVLGPGLADTGLAPGVLVSLAGHLMVGLLMILGPRFRSAPIPLGDAVLVELVGAAPGPAESASQGGAVAPPAPPPSPPPSPPAEVRLREPEPPAPKPAEKPRPKPTEPPPKGEPAVLPGAVPAQTPGAGSGPPGAGLPGAGPGGSSGGITALDAGDLEFAWYRASVTAALRSRWIRPILEDATDAIAATVSFEIRRDGSVVDVRIETSSGVPAMDRSVLRAVLESSPLPPLPPAWLDSTLPARFEFRWRPGEPG